MVDDVVKQGGEPTDPQGVIEPSPGSDVTEPSSGSESPETQEAPSGQPVEKTADGIPVDKERVPITRLNEEIEKRKQLETEIADLKNNYEYVQETPTGPVPQGTDTQEDPLMKKMLTPYPEDQRDSMKQVFQPFVDEINATKREQATIKQFTGEMLKERFFEKYSDVKDGSKEAEQIQQLVQQGYDPKHAYRLVMQTEAKMKAKIEAEYAKKVNKLNEDKRNANTVGGASGAPQTGAPPIPNTDEELEAYMDYYAKQA